MTIIVPAAPGKSADKKKRRGTCVTPRCTRAAAAGKSYCSMCRDRRWRANNPEHHLWNNLKKSAKKRGIPFSLTVEEFTTFCRRHDYVTNVGHGPDNLTVDRIDPTRGYSADNIRALTNAENARLGGYLANSGHRTPGETSLHYTAEENPLA